MDEYWAEIEGFPNYLISNMGHISNIKYGRELKPRSNGKGYLKVILYNDGVTLHEYVHRLVAENFLGGFRDGVQVKHYNGDKRNNAAHNLRIRGGQPSGPLPEGEILYPGKGKIRIIETGQVFSNVRACARHIGGDYGSIYAVLRGERRKHHGYTFQYMEEH